MDRDSVTPPPDGGKPEPREADAVTAAAEVALESVGATEEVRRARREAGAKRLPADVKLDDVVDDVAPGASSGGYSVAGAVAKAHGEGARIPDRKQFDSVRASYRETTESNPPVVTAAALLAEPVTPTPWLVEKMIPEGGLALIVAKPKAGKSTLARTLAVSIGRGLSWLGRFVESGPTLYVALEDRRLAVRDHFAQLGLGEHGNRISVYVGPAPSEPVDWLAGQIDELKPRLAVIDPLFRFLPQVDDENSYAELTNKTGALIDLARASKCAIALTHHARKSGGEDGDETLGSTALFGAVDTLLTIRRDGAARTVSTVQREGEDLAKSVLALDKDGWLNLAGTVETRDREAAEAQILAHLEGAETALRTTDIAAAVDAGSHAVKSALNRLVAAGRIARQGAGRKGSPIQWALDSRKSELFDSALSL